jgi:hypothetical protein
LPCQSCYKPARGEKSRERSPQPSEILDQILNVTAAGADLKRAACRYSMIPKSGHRFSEKIVLRQEARAG